MAEAKFAIDVTGVPEVMAYVERLRAENALLRAEFGALAVHHRNTADEEALRQETDHDMGSMIRDKLSGKITVRRNVAASIERILSASASESTESDK
jgi:hypothetical protein